MIMPKCFHYIGFQVNAQFFHRKAAKIAEIVIITLTPGRLVMPNGTYNFSFVRAGKDSNGNFTFGGRATVSSFPSIRLFGG
jgi:hypothetical protein